MAPGTFIDNGDGTYVVAGRRGTTYTVRPDIQHYSQFNELREAALSGAGRDVIAGLADGLYAVAFHGHAVRQRNQQVSR